MNSQPIEKRQAGSGDTLDVVGIFPTIQGEGPFTGHRSVFVRLAGCNLRCPGCDTNYTEGRRQYYVSELIEEIAKLAPEPQLVVITGGEPFRQNIALLANTLVLLGYPVQVESNGTLAPSDGLHESVMIVCSPKAGKIHPRMAERANCFKYVMHADSVDPDDGLPVLALDHSARPRVARPPEGNTRPVYIQPMDSYDAEQNQKNIRAVVDSCMKHGYLLQLQIHKIIGVE